MKPDEKRARLLEAAAHCLHAAAHMAMLERDPSEYENLIEEAQENLASLYLVRDEEEADA